MSEEFKIEIVNPEKSFLTKEDVTEVIVPAYEGEMGILKDHISIISFLKPGIIKICAKSEDQKYFVEDGIIEFKNNNATVDNNAVTWTLKKEIELKYTNYRNIITFKSGRIRVNEKTEEHEILKDILLTFPELESILIPPQQQQARGFISMLIGRLTLDR